MNTTHGEALTVSVLEFCRLLRGGGVRIGTDQSLSAVRALACLGIDRRDDLKLALRSTLIYSHEQLPLFERIFSDFFGGRSLRSIAQSGEGGELSAGQPGGAGVQADAEPNGERMAFDRLRGTSYSAFERLLDKDFAELSQTEREALQTALQNIRWPPERIRSRRFAPHAHGKAIDLRRTVRALRKYHGQPLEFAFRKRRARREPLVAVCDVSGSMSEYSPLFLHFVHALSRRRRLVRAFVFGTRLTDISEALRYRDPYQALSAVAEKVADWDGGTRIAENLRRLNAAWIARALPRDARVLLLTDGLESRRSSELSEELQRLRRSCSELIWLNPLLGYREFAARAYGIRTMLPHVDRFLPAHSVASMLDVAALLASERPAPPSARSSDCER